MKISGVPYPRLRRFHPKIFQAFIEDFDSVADLYESDYRRIPTGIHPRPLDPAVADRIAAYNTELGATGKALENLGKLRGPCVCIVTGQQPGALGGPLYNLYKAITAIRLAQAVEAASTVPAIPIFWNHSDDHSLDEFAQVSVPTDRGPQRITLQHGARQTPAYLADIPEALNAAIARFLELCPSELVKNILLACYDRNLARFFSRLWLSLLGPHGLVMVEPRLLEGPATRRLYQAVISDPRAVRAKLDESILQVEARGFSPILRGVAGFGLFVIREGTRHRVEYVDGILYAGGEALDAGQLIDQTLSPQVYLRPLVQDAALPTLAYVGGPNEVAYLAELKALYTHLGVRRPIIFPRISATLLEPAADRLVRKLKLSDEDLLAEPDSLLARATSGDASAVFRKLDALEQTIFTQLEAIRSDLERIERGLADALRKTGSNLSATLGGFRRRIAEALRSGESVFAERLRRLATHVLPDGILQERVFSPLYYLAAAGPGLIPQLVANLDPFRFEHRIVRL